MQAAPLRRLSPPGPPGLELLLAGWQAGASPAAATGAAASTAAATAVDSPRHHWSAETTTDPTCGASLAADCCVQALFVLAQGMVALRDLRRGDSLWIAAVTTVHFAMLLLMLLLPRAYWRCR